MARKILLVEDSRLQAEYVRHLLETGGYQVELASNGREGLERVQCAPPDLIISDVMMPEMDGYAFCQAVKSQPGTRRIPFVLLTSSNTPSAIRSGLERGADNFIAKPFEDAYLLERVRRIFEHLDLRKQGHLEVEITVDVGGRAITLSADKQQIIELLFSTFEELERLNHRLVESQRIVEEYAKTLEAKVQERTAALDHLAKYDALTDLPNRTLLRERLHQAILAGQREHRPLAVLLMDLDRFKEINDTLGHQNGDILLQQVGSRLRAALPASDSIARLGGDEFAVLLPATDAGGAARAARTILSALEPPFLLADFSLDVRAAIGIALYPGHGRDADTLLRRADVAMYRAKQADSACALYTAQQDPYSPQRLALMSELRQAIEGDQLSLQYQPKIHLQTRRLSGVEALLQWRHPQQAMIPPAQFIPLVEHTGLIKPLTGWVLGAALRQCHAWQEAGRDISAAVNLSVRNLLDPHLIDQVAGLLETWGVAPGRLILEITESAIMLEPARSAEVLTQLSAMGIRLAIDDFGTGHSSLTYLKKLPVNQVKIDLSFVRQMVGDENDAVIVRSTIDLAHNLGLVVVAEGVENRETWDRLAALGCDEAQGHFMGRPMPAADLTAWLRDSPWGGGEAEGAQDSPGHPPHG